MKKITVIILAILLILGVWLYMRKGSTPVDTMVTTYRNTNSGLSFTYPKILTVKATGDIVTVHHEVPFAHHDYCDFKGEGDTTIPNLTDFNVAFHVSETGLVQTMKTESPYLPEENFVNGTVVESPGFIDKYEIGDLKGYKIFEGAEGCGQTTYYFPITSSKTLVAKEELVTVFTGAIDKENEDKAAAVPGVLNKEAETQTLESIFKTVKVN
jgi:hypothetical protein